MPTPESKERNLDFKHSKNPPLVLSVFICGTADTIKTKSKNAEGRLIECDRGNLAATLHKFTYVDKDHVSMALDGVYPEGDYSSPPYDLGAIFGSGLTSRVKALVAKVRTVIEIEKRKVILNCYGHSRGAICALLVAKAFRGVTTNKLEINLALLDPVPGNYSLTYQMDFLGISFASQIEDATDCPHIRKVLCLYPYNRIKGNDLITNLTFKAYAPSITLFSSHTQVEHDVIMGDHIIVASCHLDKEKLLNKIYLTQFNFPVFCRIKTFMEECGTRLNFNDTFIKFGSMVNNVYKEELISVSDLDAINKTLNNIYSSHLQFIKPIIKAVHSKQDLQIVAKSTQDEKLCLNKHHASLSKVTTENLALSIQPKSGVIVTFKRKHPYLYSTNKWLIIGFITAIILSMDKYSSLPLIEGLGAHAFLAAIPLLSIITYVANRIIKTSSQCIERSIPDLRRTGNIYEKYSASSNEHNAQINKSTPISQYSATSDCVDRNTVYSRNFFSSFKSKQSTNTKNTSDSLSVSFNKGINGVSLD